MSKKNASHSYTPLSLQDPNESDKIGTASDKLNRGQETEVKEFPELHLSMCPPGPIQSYSVSAHTLLS